MQKSQKKQKGTAAVEFALVLPVLLLIVFGIVELGIALYDKAVITNASREAARAGIVLRSPKLTEDQIAAVATNYAKNHLVTFGAKNDPVVTVVSGLGGTFGVPLVVRVAYNYDGLGLGKMLSAIVGGITISATTAMNNE